MHIVSSSSSMGCDSCGCRWLDSVDPRRIKPWYEQMDDQQGYEICEGGDQKHNLIAAMSGLKDGAYEHGDEHAADSARHPADADDRPHRLAREHVGSEREQIGGPSLMCRSGEADEQDGGPLAHAGGGEHDRDDAQRAQEHRKFSSTVGGPARMDEVRRDPSTADAPDVGDQINGDEWRPELRDSDADVEFFVEEIGHPEEVEPPDGIGHELANGERPGLAMREQLGPGNFHDWIGRVAANVCQLGGAEMGMVFG